MAVTQQFNSFEELVADTEGALLIDFYATWCGPCQLMAGILTQVKEQLKDRLTIVKIDTDRYPELASKHQVYALPTMVLFKAGQEIHRIEGAVPTDQLIQQLEPFL